MNRFPLLLMLTLTLVFSWNVQSAQRCADTFPVANSKKKKTSRSKMAQRAREVQPDIDPKLTERFGRYAGNYDFIGVLNLLARHGRKISVDQRFEVEVMNGSEGFVKVKKTALVYVLESFSAHGKANGMYLTKVDIVDRLLSLNAKVHFEAGEITFKKEATPLHYAAQYLPTEMLRTMIGRGADLFAVDAAGNSVLHWAARNSNPGNFEALFAYIQKLPDNALGETPIHVAAQNVNYKVVDVISRNLPNGALDLQDSIGNTALHYAAMKMFGSERFETKYFNILEGEMEKALRPPREDNPSEMASYIYARLVKSRASQNIKNKKKMLPSEIYYDNLGLLRFY